MHIAAVRTCMKDDPTSITSVTIFQNQICKVPTQITLKYYTRIFLKTVFNRTLHASAISLWF